MTSKKLLCNIILLSIFTSSTYAGDVKPKYISTTVRLSQKTDFVRKNPAPDYWAFSPYYVPQQDGSACGIASMTMLMNAARSHQALSASDVLVTQKVLVEKIKVDYSRGLTLDQLGENIKKSLNEFKLKATVEVIHVDGTPTQTKKIQELLARNEKTDKNFIIANFNQGIFTGDPEGGGHISPVGAFDAKNKSILVMDVDREYYEPYWVSFDTFVKGMNTADTTSKMNRGFVFVELP